MAQTTVEQNTPTPAGQNQAVNVFFSLLGANNKAIIIEGFDKEGKSTLAQTLATALNREAIQFPLKLPEYGDIKNYAKVMLDIRDRLNDKVVERYALTLIAYYDITPIDDMVEELLKYVKENAVVITSTSFWGLVQFRLRDFPYLKEIAKDIRAVLISPYLIKKPDFLETVSHMGSIDSIWYIRNKLNTKGLTMWM